MNFREIEIKWSACVTEDDPTTGYNWHRADTADEVVQTLKGQSAQTEADVDRIGNGTVTDARLERLRAKAKSVREGYAVHIGACQGECVPLNPIATRYRCQGCDQLIAVENVAETTTSGFDVADVEYLLELASLQEQLS